MTVFFLLLDFLRSEIQRESVRRVTLYYEIFTYIINVKFFSVLSFAIRFFSLSFIMSIMNNYINAIPNVPCSMVLHDTDALEVANAINHMNKLGG